MKLVQLGGEPPINRLSFEDVANSEWRSAKHAYLDAHRRMDSLMSLLHRPGGVRVSGQVTGAAHEAKLLRKDVDRLIVALDEIVSSAKRVQS